MPRVEQVQQKALEEFRERNRAAVKRKKEKNTRQLGEAAITFVCLFFLMSLLFLQIAKKMTPKVDMEIGSNAPATTEPVEEPKGTIDDRLKLIQFNDSMASGELQRMKEKEIFNDALEEKVVLPTGNKASNKEEEKPATDELKGKVQDIISKNLTEPQKLEQKPTQAPVPVAEQPQAKPAVAQQQTPEELNKKIAAIQNSAAPIQKSSDYKVLVGKYQTAEQAQLAKSILRETSLGQNAFVKLVDNVYTIQIGSYSTSEQAHAVVQELTTKSFPARVYYEKPKASSDGAKNIF
ncbi:MAG: SPOR domain-containing protein [Fusobacterium sp.]|nr:SPOR domain-containing protein [Fusobacterium sp.]